MKKKIFILTGESSGDKLASNVIPYLNNKNFYITAIGSDHIKKKHIKLLFNSKEISVMGFVDVFKKLFFLKKKINLTISYLLKFKPDVIFSIDSPDFSFRIHNVIKKKLPKTKIVHLVAPTIWVWREKRVLVFRKFLDHLLLLFPFEAPLFNKWKMKNTYVGHPFFEKKITYKKFPMISRKKIITFCPGSRSSEIRTFMPLFVELIKIINFQYPGIFLFHFPVPLEHAKSVKNFIHSKTLFLISCSEEKKNFFIKKSILSVAKSGTISLDICKNQSPLITIFKTSWINYFLIKPFVKVKFANIINIIANKELIPELIQSECNVSNIYKKVCLFIENKKIRDLNVTNYRKIIKKISKKNSSKLIAKIIKSYL